MRILECQLKRGAGLVVLHLSIIGHEADASNRMSHLIDEIRSTNAKNKKLMNSPCMGGGAAYFACFAGATQLGTLTSREKDDV